MSKEKISIFWLRRDFRLEDNHGLSKALESGLPVLPLFIFDTEIIDELKKNDARVTFIHDTLLQIHKSLTELGSGIFCIKGCPANVWSDLTQRFDVVSVFANEDYEPYAIQRDLTIQKLLIEKGIEFNLYKDQVMFAKDEVVKNDGAPYTVFTPYKNKWLTLLSSTPIQSYDTNRQNYLKFEKKFPTLAELGFVRSGISVKPYTLNQLNEYEKVRNYPALNKTSYLSPHLRFGTVSIRAIVQEVQQNESFLSELIWREFFMQILYHFPYVVNGNFRKKYDGIQWRNDPDEFERWKNGQTGYPMVDAGMRELNSTGYMHNRVRMVVAGFLCKHLLVDWRWGEAYFAEKLLDYELSSNNGNWQWAAGTGCDAAPYFRVFNPTEQIKKFDSQLKYIRKWIPELDELNYPTPIVEHKFARERAINTYKKGMEAISG